MIRNRNNGPNILSTLCSSVCLLFLLALMPFQEAQAAAASGKARIEIVYSDSTVSRFPLNWDRAEAKFQDKQTRLQVSIESIDLGREVSLDASCLKPKPIKFIDVVVEYSDELKGNDLLYYYNALCGNSQTGIRKPAVHGAMTRELVLFKNTASNRYLNIGFSTFNRFFTYFLTKKDEVIVRHVMEGRPLNKGEEYLLESFIINSSSEGGEFFKQYAKELGARFNVDLKEPPTGWCSWSVYYQGIDHDKIADVANHMSENYKHLGADIIQLDDGWYERQCWGDWTANDKFPEGMDGMGKLINDLGLRYGKWYSPTIFRPQSKLFKKHFDYNVMYDGKIKKSFGGGSNDELVVDEGAFYPLDISNPEVRKLIASWFSKSVNEEGASYFKLDFLIRSLVRSGSNNEDIIFYPNGDYCIAEYNKTMRAIREAVGDDVFLLACGAPMGESIGICDAIRVSSDITQGVKTPYWDTFKNNIRTIILRSYFHNQTFVNDPDAALVRACVDKHDKNMHLTEDEVKLWLSTIALSGGSSLINEEMTDLLGTREHLYKQILPVMGKPAYPLDCFELPAPTVIQCDVTQNGEKASLVGVYNFEDKRQDKQVPMKELGYENALVMDCWSKEIVGRYEGDFTIEAMPQRSIKAYLIKEQADVPSVLFADANFFMGVDRCKCAFSKQKNTLTVALDKGVLKQKEYIYLSVPKGYTINTPLKKVWGDEHGTVYRDAVEAADKAKVYSFKK